MSLTDTKIRNLKPATSAKKYADSEGLFLYVNTSGTKSWRFRYRDSSGREKELTFGKYPELSLQTAREKRLEARKLIAAGKDPLAEKKSQERLIKIQSSNTFRSVADEWHELNREKWTNKYAETIKFRLDRYAYPYFGERQISEITALEILDILRGMEKVGNYVLCHRILQYYSAIFRLAVLTQRATYNPCNDLKGILKHGKVRHYPVIKIDELPDLLTKLELHSTPPQTQIALKLLMLTFVRQGELRRAKWEYFDLDKKIWVIPAELMKMREEHIVPLSHQAVALLSELHTISGESEYLFPTKNKIKYPYMNENTVNELLHDMGYKGKLVGHGFRSLASTTLNELGFLPDVIEKQLAHEPRNRIRAAYNRAQYMPHRIELMQAWADHIDKVCAEAAEKKNFKKAAWVLPQVANVVLQTT